ncbi:Protein of unknown function [Gryllus bimaculatus]|nr:Protein of unknown function [Gryllus bimaculatus]
MLKKSVNLDKDHELAKEAGEQYRYNIVEHTYFHMNANMIHSKLIRFYISEVKLFDDQKAMLPFAVSQHLATDTTCPTTSRVIVVSRSFQCQFPAIDSY